MKKIETLKDATEMANALANYIYENRYVIENQVGYDSMNTAVHDAEFVRYVLSNCKEVKEK